MGEVIGKVYFQKKKIEMTLNGVKPYKLANSGPKFLRVHLDGRKIKAIPNVISNFKNNTLEDQVVILVVSRLHNRAPCDLYDRSLKDWEVDELIAIELNQDPFFFVYVLIKLILSFGYLIVP